jgi:hypothetical protein
MPSCLAVFLALNRHYIGKAEAFDGGTNALEPGLGIRREAGLCSGGAIGHGVLQAGNEHLRYRRRIDARRVLYSDVPCRQHRRRKRLRQALQHLRHRLWYMTCVAAQQWCPGVVDLAALLKSSSTLENSGSL